MNGAWHWCCYFIACSRVTLASYLKLGSLFGSPRVYASLRNFDLTFILSSEDESLRASDGNSLFAVNCRAKNGD